MLGKTLKTSNQKPGFYPKIGSSQNIQKPGFYALELDARQNIQKPGFYALELGTSQGWMLAKH
jgi:hypothetical protein